MKIFAAIAALALYLCAFRAPEDPQAWIRINQLGYPPAAKKVAVWGSRSPGFPASFQLVDAATGKTGYRAAAGRPFGAYGTFAHTCRLDFSAWQRPGPHFPQAGRVSSP